jgi:membrane fusion protein (multidrug efflux system)
MTDNLGAQGKERIQAAPPRPAAIPEEKPAAATSPPARHWSRWVLLGGLGIAVLGAALYFGIPWGRNYFSTVSTDDAYVSGYVSYVSARIAGTVIAVHVEDNAFVRQGDVLVEIDPDPFDVAVLQKKAALEVARATLEQTRMTVRGQESVARAARFSLENAQQQVRYQIATLRSNVADLEYQRANLRLADAEYNRVSKLVPSGAASREDLDKARAALETARAQVNSAEHVVQRTRANLGLPPESENPADVDEKKLVEEFSAVQTALSTATQALAQLGMTIPLYHLTPEAYYKFIYGLPKEGEDLNKILDEQVDKAPATLLAKAQVTQAEQDLKYAELQRSYTIIKAPIDGFVSKRTVNPGNRVQDGQSLMAIRSADRAQIWIDANFKETELEALRIGQPVNLYVDAYPGTVFHGVIQGFSMGTGASLSLLPPENATGNFVKVVQRLPVRVVLTPETTDAQLRDTPLFVGLSVVPSVRIKDPLLDVPHAGQRLRITPDRGGPPTSAHQ